MKKKTEPFNDKGIPDSVPVLPKLGEEKNFILLCLIAVRFHERLTKEMIEKLVNGWYYDYQNGLHIKNPLLFIKGVTDKVDFEKKGYCFNEFLSLKTDNELIGIFTGHDGDYLKLVTESNL